MSDGDLKYPKWEAEFHDAVIEFDREKLVEKVQKFELAVFTRLQELASDSDHHDERQAIVDAASTVSALKKDKLTAF
jgi:hypothetical protein